MSSICKLPRCNNPVFIGPNGVPSEYCSNRHRLDAMKSGKVEACLLCWKYPKSMINGKLSDFCSKKCRDDTFNSAPLLLMIPNDQAAFGDVSKQFRDQWKHPSPGPTIVHVWKIYCDPGHIDKFQRYKLAVERDSPGKSALCNNALCSLCNIIRTSFRMPSAGKPLYYGAGIYTSATSSNSNLYIREQGGSGFKAMLLNDVVLGRVFKMTTGDGTLTQPPPGYDAVVGEPMVDADEAIVYTNEAIRPLFLIIYKP